MPFLGWGGWAGSVGNGERETNVTRLQSLNEIIHGKSEAWHTVSSGDVNCDYYYRQERGRAVGKGKGGTRPQDPWDLLTDCP